MNSLKNLICDQNASTDFITEDMVEAAILRDPRIAFEGLVQVYHRQTVDEKVAKGTSHKNLFGFSKKHVTFGSMLAVAWLQGGMIKREDGSLDLLGPLDCHYAQVIARFYRKQIWLISMQAVPTNNLYVG